MKINRFAVQYTEEHFDSDYMIGSWCVIDRTTMKAYPLGAGTEGWEACIFLVDNIIAGRTGISGYMHLDKYLTRHAEVHMN